MATSTKGTAVPTGRPAQAIKVVEFLRASKLVNLDQTVGQFVGSIGSIADDIDGHLICWQAYVLIHRPFGRDFEREQFGG
jgi:hypothetical protein